MVPAVESSRAKHFEYAVRVDRAGTCSAEDAAPSTLGDEWTPEHLVLAGLVRCSVASLQYHVQRTGGDAVADASAWGLVTKRDADGRYAFVEIECRIDAEVDPPPADAAELLAKAERDCFVGASLTAKPRYRWTVNGSPPGAAE